MKTGKKVIQHAENVRVNNKIEIGKDIKIAHFKQDLRTTLPHKHDNYFEIIYLSKGKGHHFIDQVQYDIKPPVVYFVKKEQVHHWELTKQPKGYVVIIKKSFIEKTIDSELKSLFVRVGRLSCMDVTNQETIENLFELLIEEDQQNSAFACTIIEGLLKVLLSKILVMAKPTNNQSTKKSDDFISFVDMLSNSEKLKNSVAHYARILNTSPQNLNAICRKASNQSASEVIKEFILNEAKRLLTYTSKTISEIAFELDFTDASHFLKYFKKAVGQTPLQYRQQV